MLPWYYQILVLLGVTVVVYPIVVLIVLKYYYFPSLMRSVVNECFKHTEELELEKALATSVPLDENPLETGDCEIVMGNIVRKDDEADDDEESKFEW